MNKECIYVEDTQYGCFCTIADKECSYSCIDDCSEPEWVYLMSMAEDYVEEEK